MSESVWSAWGQGWTRLGEGVRVEAVHQRPGNRRGGYSAVSEVPWWACPPGVRWRKDWTRARQVGVHAWREANREVNAWMAGEVYRWRWLDDVLMEEGRHG